MTSATGEARIAALVIVEAALLVIEGDPHQFSKRPCESCRAVSLLVGRLFGCSRINGSKPPSPAPPRAPQEEK